VRRKKLPHRISQERVQASQGSLDTDYSKIQSATKQKKQQEELTKWIGLNKGHVFIKIDDSFKNCEVLKKWLGAAGMTENSFCIDSHFIKGARGISLFFNLF